MSAYLAVAGAVLWFCVGVLMTAQAIGAFIEDKKWVRWMLGAIAWLGMPLIAAWAGVRL